MQEKGKPEADQAKYRTMLDTLSAKVLVLEMAADTGELQAQKRYVELQNTASFSVKFSVAFVRRFSIFWVTAVIARTNVQLRVARRPRCVGFFEACCGPAIALSIPYHRFSLPE